MDQQGFDRPSWISRLGAALDVPSSLAEERIAATAIVPEHPVIESALTQSRGGNAISLVNPRGSSTVELRTLVARLAEAAVQTSGKEVAAELHRVLALGEGRQLIAHEITVFDWLELQEKVVVGEGAFLAPYRDVRATYGPHAHDARRDPGMATSLVAPRSGIPDAACALVRELRWGPAVAPADERREVVEPEFQCAEDYDLVGDFLSIAMEAPCNPRRQYTSVDPWFEAFNPNLRLMTSFGFIGTPEQWWQFPLSEEGRGLFLEMLSGWRAYDGKGRERLRLAVRRLAASHSREGRLHVEDRILDSAIALETMYDLSGPELTYKLRTRAAHFLGLDAQGRKDLFRRIGKFYRARSTIVHGPSARQTLDLRDAGATGFEIGRSTLLRLLRDGGAPDWDDVALSAGE